MAEEEDEDGGVVVGGEYCRICWRFWEIFKECIGFG